MLLRNWEILNAASLNFPFLDFIGMKKTIFGERIVTENLGKHKHRVYAIKSFQKVENVISFPISHEKYSGGTHQFLDSLHLPHPTSPLAVK